MLLHGDCLDKMSQIKNESVDLVYLDPPFFTQKNHTLKTRDNSEEYSFEDTWDSLNDYLSYMKSRLIECRRVLKTTGSLYLHCDKNVSYHLRIIMDDVLGANNFRNEIIWTYKRWTNSKNCLQSSHQNIYFYSKSSEYTFNTIYVDYSASTNIDQILQERVKNEHGKSVYKTTNNGEVVLVKAKKGVALGDVWNIPYLNPKANERVGYPTQKPILLLERIIEISTNANDVVLDPFCGSGTTLVAAHLNGRKYIGIDKSLDAIKISEERLIHPTKTFSRLLENGEDKYINKTNEEILILKCLEAVPVQRNLGIDGFLNSECYGNLIPVKIQKPSETIVQAKQKLILAAKKRRCNLMILIRTHNDGQEQIALDKNYSDSRNIFVIDSYALSIENWLNGLEQIYQLAVLE